MVTGGGRQRLALLHQWKSDRLRMAHRCHGDVSFPDCVDGKNSFLQFQWIVVLCSPHFVVWTMLTNLYLWSWNLQRCICDCSCSSICWWGVDSGQCCFCRLLHKLLGFGRSSQIAWGHPHGVVSPADRLAENLSRNQSNVIQWYNKQENIHI